MAPVGQVVPSPFVPAALAPTSLHFPVDHSHGNVLLFSPRKEYASIRVAHVVGCVNALCFVCMWCRKVLPLPSRRLVLFVLLFCEWVIRRGERKRELYAA